MYIHTTLYANVEELAIIRSLHYVWDLIQYYIMKLLCFY